MGYRSDSIAVSRDMGPLSPYNLSKKYGSTPPMCTAVERPPDLYRRAFLASKLRRKGNPASLPFRARKKGSLRKGSFQEKSLESLKSLENGLSLRLLNALNSEDRV